MAQDIGTSNMADVDAVAPADPSLGRAEQNYTIPRPLLGTEFNLPKTEQSQGIEVLVRSTPFVDAVTGLKQFFSTLATIQLEPNGASVVALSIFAHLSGLVDNETKTARAGWEYQAVLDQFLPQGLIQFALISVGDDTFTGKVFNSGEMSGDDVVIAQPPKFRKSLFDGLTVDDITYAYPGSDPHAREATGDIDGEEVTITEEIIPKYTAGQIIYAMPVAGSPGLPGDARLIAMNVDGRMWAKTGIA